MKRGRSDEQVATFIHTDIEGSTRALHRLGPRYADAIEGHRRLLRRIASELGGSQVDAVGDAVLLSFSNADDAARAAIIGQLALAALSERDGEAFQVRMGIHTGPVWKRGRSYYGLTVHKVARIMALARGGQILVSADTASALNQNAPLQPSEIRTLHGFDHPEQIYEIRVTPLTLNEAEGSPR
jgi:class 3 adenylate cyclase